MHDTRLQSRRQRTDHRTWWHGGRFVEFFHWNRIVLCDFPPANSAPDDLCLRSDNTEQKQNQRINSHVRTLGNMFWDTTARRVVNNYSIVSHVIFPMTTVAQNYRGRCVSLDVIQEFCYWLQNIQWVAWGLTAHAKRVSNCWTKCHNIIVIQRLCTLYFFTVSYILTYDRPISTLISHLLQGRYTHRNGSDMEQRWTDI